MKSKSFVIGSIIIFAIGLIVCLIHNNTGVISSLLLITGLLFLIPGVLNLLTLLDRRGKSADKKPSGIALMISWISTIAAIILGAMILITPESFRSLFLFIIGAILVLFSVSLIYSMAVNLKAVNLPIWMYAMPVLVLADGVVLACNLIKHENTQALMMGLGLIVISVAFFVTVAFVSAYNRAQAKAAEAPKESLPDKA
ncbi:MAG: hypothetical protein HDS75_01940 [Bacteroidales bacterium]|nr:hypothetical protein [Bacteroidales bacterium]MDE6801153.1 hypothetical protein [Muribaculaceae bacterium]MDE6832218.1 hypothetical protein [Muribaculaceae bacterium]